MTVRFDGLTRERNIHDSSVVSVLYGLEATSISTTFLTLTVMASLSTKNCSGAIVRKLLALFGLTKDCRTARRKRVLT